MKDPSPQLIRLSPAFYLCAAAVYMGAIYFLSSLKIPLEKASHPMWSYMGNLFHFPLYAGLGSLLLLGFRSQRIGTNIHLGPRTLFWSLFILAAYGAFDEYHQSWTGRIPSRIDFLMDLNGGILAVLVLKYLLDKSFTPGRLFVFSALTIGLALLLAGASTFM